MVYQSQHSWCTGLANYYYGNPAGGARLVQHRRFFSSRLFLLQEEEDLLLLLEEDDLLQQSPLVHKSLLWCVANRCLPLTVAKVLANFASVHPSVQRACVYSHLLEPNCYIIHRQLIYTHSLCTLGWTVVRFASTLATFSGRQQFATHPCKDYDFERSVAFRRYKKQARATISSAQRPKARSSSDFERRVGMDHVRAMISSAQSNKLRLCGVFECCRGSLDSSSPIRTENLHTYTDKAN